MISDFKAAAIDASKSTTVPEMSNSWDTHPEHPPTAEDKPPPPRFEPTAEDKPPPPRRVTAGDTLLPPLTEVPPTAEYMLPPPLDARARFAWYISTEALNPAELLCFGPSSHCNGIFGGLLLTEIGSMVGGTEILTPGATPS